jgi:ABC-type molybdate transport system substrate-binding protein
MPLIAQSGAAPLSVCHAGSLQAAFAQIEHEFSRQHPGIAIADTSGGSVDLARRIAAGTLRCDVYAPADHLVIQALLKPAGLATYTIVFAGGRMVLAYLNGDPRAMSLPLSGSFSPPSSVPQVTTGWEQVLTAPGVRIGGAHPFLDPGGYRAHMIFELAQARLNAPGLYNALLQHYQVIPAGAANAASAPALGNDYDFQLTYEHSAAAAARRDPSYRYARLPDGIDLSAVTRNQSAATIVTIPGLGIAGSSRSVAIHASSVAWGVTIMNNSQNRDNATLFVSALLGSMGRDALTAHGPTPIIPGRVSGADYRRLPAALRSVTTLD